MSEMGKSKSCSFKEPFKLKPVPVKGRTGTVSVKSCPAVNTKDQNAKADCAKKLVGRLPKGLVGSKCTANVSIAGINSHCLLDSGSQVTTIPVSFYNQNLSDQPIHPLEDLLEIEGAAGQIVPYLGYVEVTMTFSCDFLGSEFEVPTLALVVPDVHPDTPSQVLIGTNTLDILYDEYLINKPNYQPSLYGYRALLKILELRHQRNQTGSIGVVRMMSHAPTLIPAGHRVLLQGTARVDPFLTDRSAVVEHPTNSPLPGGLCVQSCLVTLPAKAPFKVPVVLANETDQDVFLPSYCVIAELGSFHSVISQHSVKAPAEDRKKPNLNFNFGESPIPAEWKTRITDKLLQMADVFSHHDLDFGCTDKVKHHIKLHDETPFKHRARPIHPNDIEAVRNHLNELLQAGVIRESESPFSSPIVVVRKRNNDVRLCIDFRKLNMQTIKDAYALPNLEETLSALHGSKWFSVLDLKSGYYQIEMNEADKAKTAFVTPLGFWEFNRMPQGITNAPSTFQRLMEKSMGDLNLKEVLVFLDDLIVFSPTLEEHEKRLLKVLTRLREFGLKLSPEKCKFFQTSVRYLGHIVSENGVETDPEKTNALKTWPIPKTLKELKSFLGFAGYYRRFIKDYSALVKPLNELTRGYPPLRKSCKDKENSIHYFDPKKPFSDRWTSECQLAFESLIEKLTSAPVLGFADPRKPYILHTDASTTGLGAALYQQQDEQLRVIAYASRGLSSSEARYPAHKLEFLALKWSVTEKFHDYLYGSDFTVVTDSNPLTYILTSAKLDATSYRWLAALSTYSFKLQYRAGKQNMDADSLSRRPHDINQSDAQSQKERDRIDSFIQEHLADENSVTVISPEVVNAICQSSLIRTSHDPVISPCFTLVESLAHSTDSVPVSYASESEHGLPVIPSLSHSELQAKQRAEPSLREIILQKETGNTIAPTVRKELPELSLLLREWNKFELRNGILYRKRNCENQITYQLVLPHELRSMVLQSLHNDMGHLGIERTLDLVRTRFYWPKMAADVETKIKTCERCVRRKAFPEKAAPLVNIRANRPLELVCMDFLSLEPDSSNTKDILVITDHFTKFAVAIPTPNQKAKTVTRCLWDNFIVYYGIPEKLHTDQGTDFESKLIKELCEVAGIKKLRTTPYHPRSNPVERFNRTLLNMLGTLEAKQKTKWKEYVKPLVHAYNCTRNDVTGFTPYELMFGRSPRLPVDLAFGLPVKENSSKSHSQYVDNLKTRLEESYQLAARNASKTAERNKLRFDKKITTADLEVGDRVLVRNVRVRGKHKLSDKWEQDIYVVVKRAGSLPVYSVKPENKDGPVRTVHRDLLLPCGFLPVSNEEEEETTPATQKPKTRNCPNETETDPDTEDYMEEDDFRIWFPKPNSPLTITVETEPVLQYGTPQPEATAEPLNENEITENDRMNPEESNVSGETEMDETPGTPDESSTQPELVTEPNDLPDCNLSLRRSSRNRLPPERLQYASLGNPLVSVIQTLFQSLSSACADALNESQKSPEIHVV